MKKRKKIQPDDVVAVVERRIPPTERLPGFLYYEIMCDEYDWAKPIEIRKFVFVNFMGTIVVNRELELDRTYLCSDGKTGHYLTPSLKEKRLIVDRVNFSSEWRCVARIPL